MQNGRPTSSVNISQHHTLSFLATTLYHWAAKNAREIVIGTMEDNFQIPKGQKIISTMTPTDFRAAIKKFLSEYTPMTPLVRPLAPLAPWELLSGPDVREKTLFGFNFGWRKVQMFQLGYREPVPELYTEEDFRRQLTWGSVPAGNPIQSISTKAVS